MPKELRLTIYEFVLQRPRTLKIGVGSYHSRPGLLHTNRQIRAEASGLYYKLNKFRALIEGEHPGLLEFIHRAKVAGPGDISQIRHLTLDFDFDPQLQFSIDALDGLLSMAGTLEAQRYPQIFKYLNEAAEGFIWIVKALAHAGLPSSALTITSPYFQTTHEPNGIGEETMDAIRRRIAAIFDDDTTAVFAGRYGPALAKWEIVPY